MVAGASLAGRGRAAGYHHALMPRIEFLGNELGPPVTAEAEGGGPLLDICDEHRAPVEFSCRSTSCGTCRVEVLAGADLLEPPMEEERDVLEVFAAQPEQRLACAVRARPEPGLVRLRWAGNDA